MQSRIGRVLMVCGMILLWFTIAWAVTDNQEAVCDQPYILFCDNFEARSYGDFPGGLPPTYKNGGWAVSSLQGGIIPAPTIVGPTGVYTGQVVDGTHAVQIHSPAGANNGGPYIVGSFVSSALDVYYRWYVRWSPEYVNWPQGGQKHGGASYGNGSGQNMFPQQPPNPALLGYYTLGIVPPGACGDSVPYIGQVQSAQLCQQQNITTFVPGPWYCVEFHTRNSSSPTAFDGLIEGWINGQPVGSYSNLDTDVNAPAGATRYFNAIYLAGSINCWGGALTTGYFCNPPNAESTHTDLYRWHDNVVVATQRVGCLGTAPPPPNTPPAPINLRVISS